MTRWIFGTLALLVVGALAFEWPQVRTALDVGAGYAAKVGCSLAHNSKLDARVVADRFVSAQLGPLGSLVRLDVSPGGAVARMAGIAEARAVYRAGLGCTLVPGVASVSEASAAAALVPGRPFSPLVSWPAGDAGVVGATPPALAQAVDRAFSEPVGGDNRRTTAVIVVQGGRLLAERYAPGFDASTPMLSWSMAKSVVATLVGIAVAEGKLDLGAPATVPEWADEKDPRHAIRLDDLLRMSSGLKFDEHYGAVNDVTRMLFTAPDTAAFAASSPLIAAPGKVWAYSSGTTNIVARILKDAVGGSDALLRYASEKLFAPVGMTSAFFEVDASGTPIGSSFLFMTARDWARFGELHRRGGSWDGKQVLPTGWVDYMTRPTAAAPDGTYGAHWWLNAGDPENRTHRMWPRLPTDAYAAQGHNGQAVVVVPSRKLVVVRLGWSADEESNGIEELVANVIEALRS